MGETSGENIYTNLHALVRLRYIAQGFNYLPRQSSAECEEPAPA